MPEIYCNNRISACVMDSKLCAIPLDDFEFQIDNAAPQVIGAVHNTAEQHLSRPFTDIIARQP